MRKRVKNLFFVIFLFLFCLIVYYFLCQKFPTLALKCVFHELTGFNCPGCGITRMLFSFLQFSFVEGARYNYFFALTSPILLGIICYCGYAYICDKKKGKWFNAFCLLYVILFLCWGVFRNIISI